MYLPACVNVPPLLHQFFSQCPPLTVAELQNIRRFQAVFLMRGMQAYIVYNNCVLTCMATSSALYILMMLKGFTQLQL